LVSPPIVLVGSKLALRTVNVNAARGPRRSLIAVLARHAAARPDALGFLHVDGHARVYYGTRQVQKTHVARLKFPAPATMETWVTDQDGDPVFMVIAEPSDSLAGELRRLLPSLRQVTGTGRRGTARRIPLPWRLTSPPSGGQPERSPPALSWCLPAWTAQPTR